MTRWLVVYDPRSGIAQLNNFGFFDAETKEGAIERACYLWHVIPDVVQYAIPVEHIEDGWSWFI